MDLKVVALVMAAANYSLAALPVPPHQHDSWQSGAVPGASDYRPDLVDLLFAAGLADPRGGEYREVEVTLPWDAGRHFITHGWYFPEGFAVGWDGLVYHVTHVGPVLELATDILPNSFPFPESPISRADPILSKQSGFVGVALLLRIGEVTLAIRRFEQTSGEVRPGIIRFIPPPTNPPFPFNREQFESSGVVWLARVYHQLVEAHTNGDDRLTIDLSEFLLAARRRIEPAWNDLNPDRNPQLPRPFAFLNPVPQLRADSERRLTEKARPRFDPEALKAMSPSARIAELIDRLEDVNERQLGQPDVVNFLASPICKMLLDEGVEAVEPLIDVLDHDQRLTRSYGYWRDFVPDRYPEKVADAAEDILRAHYNWLIFRWSDPAERDAWLIRNKSTSAAERYFDLLAGDANDELQWLDAAEGLSKPGIGDELRGRTKPSVSDLLAKRALAIKTDWKDRVAFALYRWDPAASGATLRQVTRSPHYRPGDALYAARLQLGDLDAASEWATVVAGKQPVELVDFSPLWTRPDMEILQDVARNLFIGPNAPMAPSSGHMPLSFVRSPLLLQPVFRGAIMASLANTNVAGTMEGTQGGNVILKGPGISIACGGCKGLQRIGSNEKRNVRLCDFTAWELSKIQGFPSFAMDSTESERDLAITEIRDFLASRARDLRAPALAMNSSEVGTITLAASKDQ